MMKVILAISFVLFLKETKGFLKCYIGESNSAFNTTGLRIGNCTRALNSFCFNYSYTTISLYKFGCAYNQKFFNEKPCIDGEQINFHGFDIIPYCCNTSYCNGPTTATTTTTTPTTPSILTNKATTLKNLLFIIILPELLAIYF